MEIFAGTRKAFHENRVNRLAYKLNGTQNPVRRIWLSSRLQAHERAHDSIVAKGILDASKHDIRSMRQSREMYHSPEDAHRGYKATRGWEILDGLALITTIGLGVVEVMNGHAPLSTEVMTGGVLAFAFGRTMLDVTHDEQYAAMVKAHNVLNNVGLRSPIKSYDRP